MYPSTDLLCGLPRKETGVYMLTSIAFVCILMREELALKGGQVTRLCSIICQWDVGDVGSMKETVSCLARWT